MEVTDGSQLWHADSRSRNVIAYRPVSLGAAAGLILAAAMTAPAARAARGARGAPAARLAESPTSLDSPANPAAETGGVRLERRTRSQTARRSRSLYSALTRQNLLT
jgi:hypothetical protein